MKEIQVFNNEQFGQVRVITKDGEPWFVGKDVAEVLGYLNTKDAIATHVYEEDKKIIQRSENATLEIPNRGLTIINESGLYSLILSSKLPQAKKFKKWVTSDVLPSIRKHVEDDEKYLSKVGEIPTLKTSNHVAEEDKLNNVPLSNLR